METVSLVASVVSVIIGGFAIWLSVTFYRMSNKISEETKEAAKGISASVTRLESLFDRLYSDTFSMMKDTVSDMRKHMWPEKEQSAEALSTIERKADDKIKELRDQISKELSTVMSEVGRTDSKISGVEVKLSELVDKAIQQTRLVESEAQEEISMSNLILRVQKFLERYGESTLGRLINHPMVENYPREYILEAIRFLQERGLLYLNGNIENPGTLMRSKRPHSDENQQRSTKESKRHG